MAKQVKVLVTQAEQAEFDSLNPRKSRNVSIQTH